MLLSVVGVYVAPLQWSVMFKPAALRALDYRPVHYPPPPPPSPPSDMAETEPQQNRLSSISHC